jgi:hypothetical protein
MRPLAKIFTGALAALLVSLPLAAGTVSGVVRNGTTGAPAPGVEVILMDLQGGMEPIATTHSDAQGRYSFDRPEIGQQPFLLRAVFRGVYFHQPLPPGQTSADIEVFEPTQDPKALQITRRTIIFQPDGERLLVGEEYTIQNQTHPPVAFYKEAGTFEFQLAQGAQLSQVSAWGPSGMPVVVGTIDKGSNRFAISFPFRPGENGVRYSYQVPYPSNQATLRIPSPYSAATVVLAAQPSVTVASDGFAPAGASQGWNLYTREGATGNAPLVVSVSGTAPPPSANNSPGGQTAEQGSSPDQTSGGAITVVPARLTSLRWILIGGFGLLFLLGILLLLRRPRPVPAAAPASPSASASGVTAQVDREVRASVEEIKEMLFRLELRRQAGTLGEDEYARQRARAEKALRDLVKG